MQPCLTRVDDYVGGRQGGTIESGELVGQMGRLNRVKEIHSELKLEDTHEMVEIFIRV